jgi:chemotaxis protein MotB
MTPMIPSHQSHTPHQDRWLVSYADFITLLFAFFAMMYAISSVDAQKLSKVSHALQLAFDDSARGRSIGSGTGVLPDHGSRLTPGSDPVLDVRQLVTRDLATEIETHQIDVSVDRRGLILSIPEAGLFALGSDEVPAPAEALVARLASTVAQLPNQVRVEGHTDDLPIHTARFRSNWDLSTSRATRVIQLMIERGGVDPRRLSAAGYAEFRPRIPNSSEAERARNRRVDLVILNGGTALAEEPDGGRRP